MDEWQMRDHARWISSLLSKCPNLQSFVTDSDLTKYVEPVSSDSTAKELLVEFVEDVEDTIQQLYELGPHLVWEPTPLKTQGGLRSDKPMDSEKSLEDDNIHDLHSMQDTLSQKFIPRARRVPVRISYLL